jgi:pimeloyl-ACP methyl ester carboxylesterase
MMPDLLLLHGAIGSSAQLQDLAAELKDQFTIHFFNFPGHGGTSMPDHFSIPLFADALHHFILAQGLKPVDVFGYSMGGYVALYLAKHHPGIINRVATLATKFQWDELIATKETTMLQPATIEEKLPSFADTLSKRHAPNDWKMVLNNTADMLMRMGCDVPLRENDFRLIPNECLIMVGDRDKMVSSEETSNVANSLVAG